jgi:hypothetical protein
VRVRFLTPTYPRDFERTRLLRDSLGRFNPDDEHVLVVEDEHLASARSAFGAGADVRPFRDALPGSARLLASTPGFAARRLKVGWFLQQVVKLHAGRAFDWDSWVCLDSDVFLVAELARGALYDDGRPFLMELLDHPVGPHVARFNARAAELLDLPPEVGSVERVYTGTCVPMSGAVCDELIDWLERRYRGPWWLAMWLRRGTEYALYGQFARHRNGLRDVVPRDEYLSVDVYEDLPEHVVVDRILDGRAAGRPLAMVHSRLGYSPADVRRIAETVWA